jgi:inner membrane protein
MDPLAHTLFGATLAETGLKRRTRYATATLIIGANLPDVDVVAGLWGGDFELYARRGWTHGVLALLVLPVLLAAGVWLWYRWRGHRRSATASPAGETPAGSDLRAVEFRLGAVLALAYLSVWSHPLLDWLNTYGVRLLMPFDGRWFYGDTLFIVEPWFWLLMAAGFVMARSSTRLSIARWVVLTLLTSAVVLGTNLVPLWVKLGWCVGVLLLAALRWRAHGRVTADKIARLGMAVLLLYIGTTYGLARYAESQAAQEFVAADEVQSNPAPGNPFAHRLVVVEPDRYRVVAESGVVHDLPRTPPDPIVQAALADQSIRGFANWMRYPYWTVKEEADHWVVEILDLRYQGPDMANLRGFGAIEVKVEKSGLRGSR